MDKRRVKVVFGVRGNWWLTFRASKVELPTHFSGTTLHQSHALFYQQGNIQSSKLTTTSHQPKRIMGTIAPLFHPNLQNHLTFSN